MLNFFNRLALTCGIVMLAFVTSNTYATTSEIKEEILLKYFDAPPLTDVSIFMVSSDAGGDDNIESRKTDCNQVDQTKRTTRIHGASDIDVYVADTGIGNHPIAEINSTPSYESEDPLTVCIKDKKPTTKCDKDDTPVGYLRHYVVPENNKGFFKYRNISANRPQGFLTDCVIIQ